MCTSPYWAIHIAPDRDATIDYIEVRLVRLVNHADSTTRNCLSETHDVVRADGSTTFKRRCVDSEESNGKLYEP
jgi:hypothetical protein